MLRWFGAQQQWKPVGAPISSVETEFGASFGFAVHPKTPRNPWVRGLLPRCGGCSRRDAVGPGLPDAAAMQLCTGAGAFSCQWPHPAVCHRAGGVWGPRARGAAQRAAVERHHWAVGARGPGGLQPRGSHALPRAHLFPRRRGVCGLAGAHAACFCHRCGLGCRLCAAGWALASPGPLPPYSKPPPPAPRPTCRPRAPPRASSPRWRALPRACGTRPPCPPAAWCCPLSFPPTA